MSRSGIYDLKYGFIPDDDVPQEPLKQTNADRFFRNVTNEQLAQYMDKIASCEFCPARRERCGYGHGCIDAWLEWLKQEADSG